MATEQTAEKGKFSDELQKQRRKSETKDRVVESVDIQCAENGYSVRVRTRSTKSTKGDEAMPYEEPKSHVFNDVDALLTYVREALE